MQQVLGTGLCTRTQQYTADWQPATPHTVGGLPHGQGRPLPRTVPAPALPAAPVAAQSWLPFASPAPALAVLASPATPPKPAPGQHVRGLPKAAASTVAATPSPPATACMLPADASTAMAPTASPLRGRHQAQHVAAETASGFQAHDTRDAPRVISETLGSQDAALGATVVVQGSPADKYGDAEPEASGERGAYSDLDATPPGVPAQDSRAAAPELSREPLKARLPSEQPGGEVDESHKARAALDDQAEHDRASERCARESTGTGRCENPSNQDNLEDSLGRFSQMDTAGDGLMGSKPCPLLTQQWTSSLDTIAWLEDGKQGLDNVSKEIALKKLGETALRLLRKSHRRRILEGVLEARLAAEDPALFTWARQLCPSAPTLVEVLFCDQKVVRRKTVFGLACFQAVG